MSWWRQLRLLLWKNYVSHRRQKLRVIVEIFWPLLLMGILMWVRTRGLRTFVHECHFDQKALPSAGLAEFIKSTVCSFNNTCNPQITDGKSAIPLDERSPSSYEQVENILKTHLTSENLKNFEVVDKDLQTISQLTKVLTNPYAKINRSVRLKDLLKNDINSTFSMYNLTSEEIDFLDSTQINWTLIPLMFKYQKFNILNLFCSEETVSSDIFISNNLDHEQMVEQLKEKFCDNTNSRSTISKSFEALQIFDRQVLLNEISSVAKVAVDRNLHIKELNGISQTFGNIVSDMAKMSQFSNFSTDFSYYWNALKDAVDSPGNNTIRLVQLWICGRNSSVLYERFSGEPGTRLEELGDEMKEHLIHNRQSNTTDYIYDNSTTPACNELFHSLEGGSITKVLWKQLKPFIRGKIIYAPKRASIERVLNRVINYFEPVKLFHNFTKIWLNDLSPRLNSSLKDQSSVINNITKLILSNNIPFLTGWISREFNIKSNEQQNNVVSILDQLKNITTFLSTNGPSMLETTDAFLTKLSTYLDCVELNKLESYNTEDEIVRRGLELIAENKLWAGLVFENTSSNSSASNVTDDEDVLPPYVRYKIRMDASKIDSTKKIQDRIPTPGARRRPVVDLKYLTFGFAYLQDLIEKSIIREHTNMTTDTGIYLQQFPYPCHIYDQFIMAISRSFPMFMVLSWVYNASMLIKSIVHEKERRLKEVMKVMGLSNSVLWSSWFIESFIFFIASSFLLVLILHYGKVLTYSDPVIVFIFLICYSISVITSSFTISTVFGKANMAAAGGGMIFFMTYLPYTFLVMWDEILLPHEKALGCLFPNVAFGFGCKYLAHFEEEGVGIQWSNIASSPMPNDGFNMLNILNMLLFDSFVNILLTAYIEAVFPGQYGVPKPFYFFLLPSYWCKNRKTIVKDDLLLNNKLEKNSHIEEEPKDLKLGISISNLTKVYSGGKVAVDNLSLNFYEGQITSFLGHNGAGKTTTISILTGLFPPTSGTAHIYGQDITTDMDSVRQSLGTCPQYNVLFNHLTVVEHLWFYASLKGSGAEVKQEIDDLINDLGISHKREEFSVNLSGGMQRKLSIAIAFVGGSRTVILDEPTAGVDPYSRRSIWELLIKYKAGRTVILTTHHMDEADLLGDRIAVIANGKLRCVGSSLFLKARFGSGYYLTFVTKDNTLKRTPIVSKNNSGNDVTDCVMIRRSKPNSSKDSSNENINRSTQELSDSMKRLTEFIQNHIPNAQMIEKVGSEATYLLPTNSQESGRLQKLLKELDDKLVDLPVKSYGISDTPLEEVFLRVTGTLEDDEKRTQSLEEAVEKLTEGGRYPSSLRLNSFFCNNLTRLFQPTKCFNNSHNSVSSRPRSKSDRSEDYIPGRDSCYIPMQDLNNIEKNPLTTWRIQGWELKKRQFWALQRKRFHHTRRNTRALLCEIVLPALLICVSMLFTLIVPPILEEPQLELKPWLYGPPNYIFYADDSLGSNPVAKNYVNELLGAPGIGTKCVQGIPEKYRSLKPQLYKFSSIKRSHWSDTCDSQVSDRNLTSPQSLSLLNKYIQCDCTTGTMECPKLMDGFDPPSTPIISGDIMYNATGRNVSDWLIKTRKQHYKKMYGGFSFAFSSSMGSFNYTSVENLLSYLIDLVDLRENREYIMKTYSSLTQSLIRRELWNNVKVWFNNKGWAASVAYLNAANNVILRANLPDDVDKRYYGITVINHPMNFTEDQLKDEMFKRGGLSLLHSITVLFAMSFVPASFVLYLIEDRVSGSKHLQFVSGVDPNVYWISTFLWDMANYMIPTFLCVMIFVAFNVEAYIQSPNIYGFITLLILYGFATIPLMYPTSYLFKVPSSAFVVLASVNLFIGTVSTVSTFVLELFDDDGLQYVGNLLKKVFLIFPQYCLGRGLLEMSANHLASRTFAKFGVSYEKNPFNFTYIGRNMLALFIQGVVFFKIVLWLESGILWWRMREPKAPNVDDDEEDDDVAAEREKIIAGLASDNALRVENLTKVYREGQLPAVNKLWMSVGSGECFGLLGVNGAGKTSTFKMLTGDIKISSGEAYIAGFRVKTEMTKARQHIGYCPQFDALDSFLSGWEHLEFYARLRGIPEEQISKIVRWSIRKLGLSEYSNVIAGAYSGGNKRKLSTAIALVGQPSIVFLDEPTTGMDPKARRFLWNCIIDIVKDKCAVVLTSHSMEECEALCTRLAIMVNGRFRCLGSTQHLKSKFGEGYTVTIRVNREDESKMKAQSFIDKAFDQEASLKEVHLNQMEYQIGSKISISSIFAELEKAKMAGILSDYSVTQTTLDQVFIRFARNQMDSAKQNKN